MPTTKMPAKYQPLPTEPQYSPPFSSRVSSPSPSRAVYPPLYENHSFDSNQDIEQEAPCQRVRRDSIPSFDSDPRFHQPTPSPFVRAALLLFTAFLFWLAFNMRKTMWVESGMGMSRRPVEEVDPSY